MPETKPARVESPAPDSAEASARSAEGQRNAEATRSKKKNSKKAAATAVDEKSDEQGQALERPASEQSGAGSLEELEELDELSEVAPNFERVLAGKSVAPGTKGGSTPPPPPTRPAASPSVAPRPASRPPQVSGHALEVGRLSPIARVPRPESSAPPPNVAERSNTERSAVDTSPRPPMTASKLPPPPPLKGRSVPPPPVHAPAPPSNRRAVGALPLPPPARRGASNSPLLDSRPPTPVEAGSEGLRLPPSVPPPVHASLLSPGSARVAFGPPSPPTAPQPAVDASVEAIEPEDIEEATQSEVSPTLAVSSSSEPLPSGVGVEPSAEPEVAASPHGQWQPLPAPARAEASSGLTTDLPQVGALPDWGDSDILPTQFDVSAGERHASPWTTEGQQGALREQAAELVELLEAQLQRKPERSREGRLHYEVARFYESPLRKLDQASAHYETAARLTPEHIPTLRGARRVLSALGKHKQALRMLDAELAVARDSAARASLLFQKGRLLADRLGLKSEAREAFEQAAELAPTRLDVLKALASAEEQAGASRKWVVALERAANAAVRFPAQRAAYLAQMARVHSTLLDDPNQAIELYKAALSADPHAPSALHALKELLYQQRRWKELIEALELEAQLATGREAQALAKFRAGLLWMEQLGDAARAAATLEQASSLSPSDVAILEELVRLYDVADQPKSLASALERLAALQEQVSVDVLHTLGQLYEDRLNQPELAIERYAQALAREPGFRPASIALSRMWEQRGEWRALAEMYNKEAEVSPDTDLRASLHVRIADLCELRLGSVEYAVEHYKKALELRPHHDGAFKALVRLYSQLQRWADLIELYRRRVEVAPAEDERISLLFSIGRVEEEALGLPEAAARTYESILAIDAGSLAALHALQRAAERGGEFRQLIAALDTEVKHTRDPKRQFELRHRAACVASDELKDHDSAIERLRALIKDEPSYQPALASLAELLFKQARWEELLGVYTAELAVTKVPAQRAALLFKMGELCERRLSNTGHAINHYRAAVHVDAEHHAATVALRRLLTRNGQFDEVARLLEAEAKHIKEPRRAARTWFLLGDVCENRLGGEKPALERALAAYKRAVELDPAFRPAIDGCLRLHEQAADHKPLVERLTREQQEAPEPLFALSAAFRAGEVLRDQLRQPAEAAVVFESILEKDPGHVGALLALERIYTLSGDADALSRTYQRQVAAFDDADARVAAYRGYLSVLERAENPDAERLKQTQMALLQIAPGDAQALFALEALALGSGDLTLTSQVDAKLSVAGLDPHSTSAHQTRLAEAMEARGDRSALSLYRAALSHDADNLAAARGICRIAERSGAPDLLAEAAEQEANVLARPDEAARLLVLSAAKLTSGGDLSSAAQKLARALHIDPDHARAATALVALQGQGLAPEFITDTLSRAANKATSKERRAALWVAVARLESRGRADIGAAIAAVQRALKERPSDVEAHLLLAHFYAGSKKWDDCVAQLQALLKLNPADDVKFDALLRLATIQHERLKATALAANNVTQALAMQPENREALELMLKVQLDREELNLAAQTAQKLVATAKSDPERARALFHSARLQRQKGDLEAASTAFAEALALTGTEDAVAQEYKQWLEARRAKADWRPYADALTKFLERPELTPVQVLKARRALGHALYDRLDERSAGLQELSQALKLAPTDAELRREYAERLERAGEYEAALSEYELLLKGAPHLLNSWRSLAACYAGLGKTDQARLALAPLVAAGEATDAERERYEARSLAGGKPRAGAFGEIELRAVEHGLTVSAAAVELLHALSPALPKLFPIPFDTYRVSSKDKVGSRGSHPLRAVAEDVAAVFGVAEFDLYVHRSAPTGVAIECGDVPTLFVNAQLESLGNAEQWFAFARVFANAARGTHLVDKLSARQLEMLLVCAVRGYEPGFGSELADAATLDAEARRISKAMPWFKGNRLEPAARAFATSHLHIPTWVQDTHIAAIRAAACLCDDPALALAAVARAGADEAVLERVGTFLAADRGQALKRSLFG